MKTKLFFIALPVACSVIRAQPANKAAAGTLNVFLNCENCYGDFVKTEIRFVNYVRDRQSADVDLFITSQAAGPQSTQYSLFFIGLKKFSGVCDTLIYLAKAGNTEDNSRRELVQVIKLGLVRYVSHTACALQMQIESADLTEAAAMSFDKWHSWVFNISGNGSLNSEKSSFSQNYSGSVSANKTTEQV